MFDINKLNTFKIDTFGILNNINLFDFPIATRALSRQISSDLVAVQPMRPPLFLFAEQNEMFKVKQLKKFKMSDTSPLTDKINELLMIRFFYGD